MNKTLLARSVSAVGVMSGLLGIFVWLTGIPDLKTLVYGPDESLKQDRRILAELEREQKAAPLPQLCSPGRDRCLTWTLVRQDGTALRLGAEGVVTLVGFGSTMSACRHMSEDIDILVKAIGRVLPIKGYYVAVDTRVDTLERLREFRSHFGLGIDLLTGSETDLLAFAKPLRAFYRKGVNKDGTPYLDHTSIVTIFDAQGYTIGWLSRDVPLPKAAEHVLKAILAANRDRPPVIEASLGANRPQDSIELLPRASLLTAAISADYSALKANVTERASQRKIKPCK